MTLFGTDGIRGIANSELTPELALRVGRAVAAAALPDGKRIAMGRDTRISGTMLEGALVAGIASAGRDVALLGVCPTPALAHVTRASGAAAGVMISASHNPVADNGIKIFGADGFKLSDQAEEAIEASLDTSSAPPTGTAVGQAYQEHALLEHYRRLLESCGNDLSPLTLVVDAAHGAAYEIAPAVLRTLGAQVFGLHLEPDGARINVGCGATDLRPLQAKVRELAAQGHENVIGIAFDGDADRALFVDETATPITGDHVLFALARHAHERGELPKETVVGTVMSNAGFEHALKKNGIGLRRTPVGDRYVLQEMRSAGLVLGGEQSGHLIDLTRSTTGDGVLTAVRVASIVAQSGTTLHALTREVVLYPQVLVNVPARGPAVLESIPVRSAIALAEEELAGSGRVLVRPSGTEPLIRIMMEGPDRARIEALSKSLAQRIAEAAL